MKNLLAGAIVLFLLFPVSQVFAQLSETPSALGVKLTATQPFIYRDDEGYTVVIGEVENTRSFPVTNVKVWVGFYSDKASGPGGSTPLETTTGTPLLEVIAPYSKSPFVIKSQTPDPEIAEVNINMLGFNSAGTTQKQQLLEVKPVSASIGDTVKVSAEITNKGQQDSVETKVHLIGLDAFSPPRIIAIHTMDVGDVAKGATQDVDFDVKMDSRVTSFRLVAESGNYQSKFADVAKVTLTSLTKLISINNVQLMQSGSKVSEVHVGTPVDITSQLTIQFGAQKNPKQEYVYYAQVKQFGEKAPVEFLGVAEGVFDSAAPQTAAVIWTPEHEGAFFVETYVWDTSGVALAAPSKTVSIILVKP